MVKKNMFVVKNDITLKSNIPTDILIKYLESLDIYKSLYSKKYTTQLERFEFSLAKDFIIWVQYYYGVE